MSMGGGTSLTKFVRQNFKNKMVYMPIIKHDYQIQAADELTAWRYMSKKKFESLLLEKSLFFCRADKFSDPFEGSIPRFEYNYRNEYGKRLGENLSEEVHQIQKNNIQGIEVLHQNFRKSTVVNCWQLSECESDAMWQLYLKDNEGIAVKTTVMQLKESLKDTDFEVGISKVRYLDFENDIWYHPDEYPVSWYNALTPILHKRIEFSQESELRLYHNVCDPQDVEEYWKAVKDAKGIFIPVDVNKLISEVIFAPTSNDESRGKTEDLIKRYGFSFPTRKSILTSSPLF
jgi:hypothetical protein